MALRTLAVLVMVTGAGWRVLAYPQGAVYQTNPYYAQAAPTYQYDGTGDEGHAWGVIAVRSPSYRSVEDSASEGSQATYRKMDPGRGERQQVLASNVQSAYVSAQENTYAPQFPSSNRAETKRRVDSYGNVPGLVLGGVNVHQQSSTPFTSSRHVIEPATLRVPSQTTNANHHASSNSTVAASRGQMVSSTRHSSFQPVFVSSAREQEHPKRSTAGSTSGYRPEKRPDSDSSIVFPDSRRFVPQVGEDGPCCANGSTFCTDITNYPSNYVQNVLKLDDKFSKELLDEDFVDTISRRILDPGESELCPSEELVIYPKVAQNHDDKWLFVVNQGDYKQGVRIEKCLKENNICKFTESFPLGYKTVCKQKYIYRRMVALNSDGKPYSDFFRIPSCCACHVRSDLGFRIEADITPRPRTLNCG